MVEKSARSPIAFLLIAIVVLYAAILIVAPVLTIIAGAFQEGIPAVVTQLTSPDALAALKLTTILTVLASAINTVLGIMVAWVLVRQNFPGKTLLNGLVDLPFVMSPVIVGFVVVMLFGRQGWIRNLPFQVAFAFLGMLLVTVFVSLPFVIREVMPVLAALTSEQEEAARTLGASQWTVFRRIIFPGIRHGVVYGLVLTLARALGEFGAAAVAGGGIKGLTETATIYVYRTMQNRNEVGAYSMAILLGVISIVVLIAMNLLRQRPVAKKELSHVDLAE
ncbi:MAG: sulfate ABC transporter permease subunit [Chloroflexi bacterium]|nr:sulfate ABC transporter permease subunit [Chloroflexota bacterium]